MSLPVVERIARVITARVGTISDLGGVLRPVKSGDIRPVHRSVVLMQAVPTINAQLSLSGASRVIAWDQNFALDLYLAPSDLNTDPIEQHINQFAAEVMQAICTPADWWLFKEVITNPIPLAVKARWDAPDLLPDSDELFAGLELNLIVTFRHTESDPFTPVP